MNLNSILKGALPVAAGVLLIGLAFKYFGDQPILKDAKSGFTG